MHYPGMIVGPDPDAQLEPLADHVQVPRYKLFLEARDVALMSQQFSMPESDLAALAARMPEWMESEGGVEDGRLFQWSTENPQSKYDWYQRGGRFTGSLQLKQPQQPAGWRRLFGAKPKDRVDQARKSEIQPELLLANPPTAVLLDGVWHECPFTSEPAELERWSRRFAELFASIPDDALLTIMDMHS